MALRQHIMSSALAVTLLLATGLLSGQAVTAAPASGQEATGSGTLQWGACPPDVTAAAADTAKQVGAELECATLRVPLDYLAPDGRTMEIAVSRLRTAKPGLRQGVLLLNPGGPGGRGLDFPVAVAPGMSPVVLDRFDLIGFDPRFVGHSTPMSCGLTFERLEEAIPWPLPGGVEENAEVVRTVAESCARNAGGVLPFVTTANTARDMDEIRQALDEEKISYLGFSYGTYLGAVYASLFPEHTDRFVLDSNVSPNRVWREMRRLFGPGVEIRFPDFTDWAAARDSEYHLGSTPGQVHDRYFELAERLDKEHIDLPDSTTGLFPSLLTGNLFRELTTEGLYFDFFFPDLAALWQAVNENDRSRIAELVPSFYLDDFTENESSAFFGIVCDDAPSPRSVEQYQHDVRHDSVAYPVAGGMAANVWPCAFWPNDPVESPIKISDEGPANILMLQNLRDPATPYIGALDMRKALGHRARMVTVDAGGHIAYLLLGNPCADHVTNAFLVTGALPPTDVACPATPSTPQAIEPTEAQLVKRLR
jgi:pimeloyl-ACP methyl ester carboxylesterase